MPKILTGKIVSVAMQNTIVVEVQRSIPHPLYRKLMKRSKKHKVHVDGEIVIIGQVVKIIETKPMSKGKHFRLLTTEAKVAKETKATKESAVTKEVLSEKKEATIAVKPKKAVKKAKKEEKGA